MFNKLNSRVLHVELLHSFLIPSHILKQITLKLNSFCNIRIDIEITYA